MLQRGAEEAELLRDQPQAYHPQGERRYGRGYRGKKNYYLVHNFR